MLHGAATGQEGERAAFGQHQSNFIWLSWVYGVNCILGYNLGEQKRLKALRRIDK